MGAVKVSPIPKEPTHDTVSDDSAQYGEVIDRNELGQFDGKNALTFTPENAAEKQAKGVIAKQEKKRNAIESAFKNGNDIPWEQGFEDCAMVLVRLIHDETKVIEVDGKEELIRGTPGHVKVRAFDSLSDKLSELLPVGSPLSISQTNNYFTDNIALARAVQDAACPVCDTVREYACPECEQYTNEGSQRGAKRDT